MKILIIFSLIFLSLALVSSDNSNITVESQCSGGCNNNSNITVESQCSGGCNNNSNSSCKLYYWYDNTNKECGQKQFCGAYMYQGLYTFQTKTECQNAAGEIIVESQCGEGASLENGKCIFNLSNGRKAEIKILPEVASQSAIERLGELNFTIELKEVGKNNNETVYELNGKKEGKFLGIFKIIANVKAQVDTETGEVKKVIKPWWSFLASGI